ncbi:MAG: hypothetical protein E6448_04190 [Actinomyces sp.]|nr:hypothetical protein [Actinomyces sp.]
MAHRYRHEIFAIEIALLNYHIAKPEPSLVTVSMRTQELMRALPEFLVDEA